MQVPAGTESRVRRGDFAGSSVGVVEPLGDSALGAVGAGGQACAAAVWTQVVENIGAAQIVAVDVPAHVGGRVREQVVADRAAQ